MSTSLFSKTPLVVVPDNRGLTVRDITWHLRPPFTCRPFQAARVSLHLRLT